jgi:hypothetical protein
MDLLEEFKFICKLAAIIFIVACAVLPLASYLESRTAATEKKNCLRQKEIQHLKAAKYYEREGCIFVMDNGQEVRAKF